MGKLETALRVRPLRMSSPLYLNHGVYCISGLPLATLLTSSRCRQGSRILQSPHRTKASKSVSVGEFEVLHQDIPMTLEPIGVGHMRKGSTAIALTCTHSGRIESLRRFLNTYQARLLRLMWLYLWKGHSTGDIREVGSCGQVSNTARRGEKGHEHHQHQQNLIHLEKIRAQVDEPGGVQ